MTGDERARAAELAPAARLRFVTGRTQLRRLIGAYLEVDPASVSLRSDDGRPVLCGGSAGADLSFSVSHSGYLVLVAFARDRPIGVDVERLRPVPHGRAVFGRIVGEEPSGIRRGRRDEWVLVHWTRREALAKASGRGLSWAVAGSDVDTLAEDRLRVFPLAAADGYVGHLAVGGAAPRIRCASVP